MKIAAYCRVSTDKSDQANSFESQKQYFREYIARQPGWELFEIYADEGLSGTATEKRAAFNRMIEDAGLHRFELIITKEVSRFSRNILDTVSFTRKLRSIGVGVYFMNDGINTLEPDSELRLSIMGSLAQEESRKTSSRVKWGQTRRMEQGVVFGRSMLGYDVKNGKMTVNPEGAAVVRLIFHKYVLERKGTTVIARELREAGFKTVTGRADWRNTVILKILKNEKYCGDLKQKKTVTPNYLTHKKKYNHGEEEFVFQRDHHEPVIERGLWEEAQREIAARNPEGKYSSGHGNRYLLSGKVRCAECGSSFVSRVRRRSDGTRYRVWRCGRATNEGARHIDKAGNELGCSTGYQLREDVGIEMLLQSVGMLQIDREAVSAGMAALATEVLEADRSSLKSETARLKNELALLGEKKKNLLDAFFSRSITEEEMKLMKAEYDRRGAELAAKLSQTEAQEASPAGRRALTEELRSTITKIQEGGCARKSFLGNLLDGITAYPDRRLELRLKQLPVKWTYKTAERGHR